MTGARLLLAAGESTRMGVPKPLLEWGGYTLIEYQLAPPRPPHAVARLVDVHRHSGSLITVPTFEEKRGHPPVLDGSLLPELREVNEATQGLRAGIARDEADVTELAFETASVLLDLNQPQDYQAARASYFVPAARSEP